MRHWSERLPRLVESRDDGAMAASRARDRRRPPTVRSVLVRFALGSAVAILVVGIGGYLALRSVATDEAKRDTRTRVQEAGQLVESSVAQGLLTGRPAAISAIDDVVL